MEIASHILPKQILYQLPKHSQSRSPSQGPGSFAIHLTVGLSDSDAGTAEFPSFTGVTDLPPLWDSALQKALPYSYLRIHLDPAYRVIATANYLANIKLHLHAKLVLVVSIPGFAWPLH
jgi:hypothetical protein